MRTTAATASGSSMDSNLPMPKEGALPMPDTMGCCCSSISRSPLGSACTRDNPLLVSRTEDTRKPGMREFHTSLDIYITRPPSTYAMYVDEGRVQRWPCRAAVVSANTWPQRDKTNLHMLTTMVLGTCIARGKSIRLAEWAHVKVPPGTHRRQ